MGEIENLRPSFGGWQRFYSERRFAILLVVLVVLLAGPPVLLGFGLSAGWFDGLMSLLMLAAILSLCFDRRQRLFALLLGILGAFLVTHPAQAQYHIYWGDMHGHTNISDGKGSLDDYFRYARDVAKLDFVVVSDHDFGNAAPWKMPKKMWTLTQDKADLYTAKGRFVAIAGYEWTS